MGAPAPACFVGVDMGTTNTRAWCISDRRIVASARAGVGIRDAALRGGSDVLEAALVELVRALELQRPPDCPAPLALVAAGMITSELGIAEVPHLPAPAGAAELAAAVQRHSLRTLPGMPLYLVPGVRTGPVSTAPADVGAADVMRGEETLCVGLHAAGALPASSTLLNVGSHWKTVRLDSLGRVAESVTALSGELLHAAQTRTILAGSVPGERPERLEPGWAREGVEEARRSGLERALFCVRLLAQRTRSSPAQRLSYLVGAFVGSALPRVLARAGEGTIVVTGGAAVRDLFAELMRAEGRAALAISDDEVEQAMARGLAQLAELRIDAQG